MEELKDFKIGVLIGSEEYGKLVGICSCGYHGKMGKWDVKTCPTCGNTKFVEVPHHINRKSIAGKINVISKDVSGFVMEKKNIIAVIDRTNETIKLEMGRDVHKVDLSFRRGDILVWKNGVVVGANENNLDTAFRYMKGSEIISEVSVDGTRAIFEFANTKLSCQGMERTHKLSRAFLRMFKYPSLQILSASGIGYDQLRDCYNNWRVRDSKKTKPHEIIGLPKCMMKFVKENEISLNETTISRINYLSESIDTNKLLQLLAIFTDESSTKYLINYSDTFLQLMRDYGYSDLKRLATYLTREVKLHQGITSPSEAMTLLRDYIRMSRALEYEYDAYPKSLKKVHDITMMNYKVAENQIKDRQMQGIVAEDSYKDLEFADKEYKIVLPTCVKNVIAEGESLSHCVATYVDDIINKKCKIVFLRTKEDLEKSLVTIEVRGGSIRQVRGKYNRRPATEESAFVRKWAEDKKLGIDCTL